ncbi:hypothetical protein LTR17_021042 [Elasticomyces elasticus]|nr:hypothetical protein LTR17_021042 [Elasticomyces elasticus]
MAAIIRSTTRSNDDSETATLMGVPKELRDAIWEFALSKDESVLPYLERRTIARPDRKPYQMGIVRQLRRQPPSPPLFHVDKRTRKEAYPIYWRSNIFAFALGSDWNDKTVNMDQVRKWQTYATPTGFFYTYGQEGMDKRPMLEVLWTVRLEFMMHQPNIKLNHMRPWDFRRYTLNAETTPEGLLRPASIDVRLAAGGSWLNKAELVFSGVLAEACTCWVRAEADNLSTMRAESRIAYFAGQVEQHLKEFWAYPNPTATITRVCQGCGKLEVTPRNPTGVSS